MSTNKADIQQIQKYLRGELDAKAMHDLEKQAQDDPFLRDAIEGYEAMGTDQQANFDEVKERFAQRNGQGRTIRWRTLSIAATLLVMLGAGWLFYRSEHKGPTQTAASLPVMEKVKVLSPPVDTLNASSQNKDQIAGRVTDPTGHALAGVKVRVKGTRLITRTDTNGRFSLFTKETKGILNIAATGFDAKQIKLDTNKHDLKVVLNESPDQLASVSVTAYVEDDKPANRTHPAIGWRAFREYLRHNAFVETGETGLVKLAFTVSTDGNINDIRVIRGKNDAMNQKAIDLVLNGPAWKGITKGEMRLKILFRKSKES